MIAIKFKLTFKETGCDFWSVNEPFHCCSPDNQCGYGEGDCDTDEDCRRGLFCGMNNCDPMKNFDPKADCCTIVAGSFDNN